MLGQTWGLGTCLLCGLAQALPWQCLLLLPLWLCLADPALCHASLVDRNKHVFLAGSLALDGWLLALLSLSRRSRFMPEQIQDVLLAVASMACGGLHILLRLLSLHSCNEYPSLPKIKQKKSHGSLLAKAQQLAAMTIHSDVLRQEAAAGPESQPNGAVGLVCLPVTDRERQLLSYCQKDTLTSCAKRSGRDGEH